MNTYHESDLSFWIEWYTDNYRVGICTISNLSEKLKELESLECEWASHKDYRSYYASVDALRIVIDKIIKGEIYKNVKILGPS